MSYAALTFQDRNSIKRWLHTRRLVSAISVAPSITDKVVMDFGAGNGELCKHLAHHAPKSLICYEPNADFLREARDNLEGRAVTFANDPGQIPPVDVIFCLEVFEHLSDRALLEALATFRRVLKPGGTVIIGVPIEIGPPAFVKGAFRMLRSFGQFDAIPKNVVLATLGRAPTERPFRTDVPDYSSYHLGFDHRRLRQMLRTHFSVRFETCSPFHGLGAWANSEIYFVLHS